MSTKTVAKPDDLGGQVGSALPGGAGPGRLAAVQS